jgi:hypothetical protein
MSVDPFAISDSDVEPLASARPWTAKAEDRVGDPSVAVSPAVKDSPVAVSPIDLVQEPPAGVKICTAGKGKKAVPKRKGRGRVLRRRTSCDGWPSELTAIPMVALVGKPLKAPVVVYPLKAFAGKQWVSVSEHLLWLRRACSDKGETHYKTIFQSAVTELRTVLKKQVLAALSSGSNAAEQLRATLDLKGDSGDEGGQVSNKKPSKVIQKGTLPEAIEVQLDGVPFLARTTLRPLRIEATCPAVLAVVKFCQRHVKRGQVLVGQQKQKANTNKGFSMPEVACPPLVGKVTWQPSTLSWAIHYRNADNKNNPETVGGAQTYVRASERFAGAGIVRQRCSGR